MRPRILAAMFLSAAIAVIGLGVPLALSVQELYRDEALLTISEEAAEAVGAVPGTFASEHDPPELPTPEAHLSVALYDITGQRLQGDGPPAADPVVAATLRTHSPQRDPSKLIVAYPVNNEEILVGVIRTSIPTRVVDRRTHRTWAAMAGLAATVLTATGLIAAFASRKLTKPLAALHTDAATIGSGALVHERPPSGIREIDTIHHALTDAATQLNDALARERSLGADLAHQLRTPLASLRLRVETEQRNPTHDQRLSAELLRDIDRLEQTVIDVLTLARDTHDHRDPHPLATSIREAVATWAPTLQRAGRELLVTSDDHLPWTTANLAAIRQILDVLLDNAVRHGEGTVHLAASRVGDGAVITIADHGTATIDPRTAFTRRSTSTSRSGIGLALARRLAEAEGLDLALTNPGPGVTFQLALGAHAPQGTRAGTAVEGIGADSQPG